jgi:peptidoglycan hydrolase-like protein with peptidoglycan-binding domain
MVLSDEQAQRPDYTLTKSSAQLTLETMPSFPGMLRRGAQGPAVVTLQMRLVELGYSEVGALDGIFGRNTEAAVRTFQARNRLEVDGIAGPRTWERLFGADGVPNG